MRYIAPRVFCFSPLLRTRWSFCFNSGGVAFCAPRRNRTLHVQYRLSLFCFVPRKIPGNLFDSVLLFVRKLSNSCGSGAISSLRSLVPPEGIVLIVTKLFVRPSTSSGLQITKCDGTRLDYRARFAPRGMSPAFDSFRMVCRHHSPGSSVHFVLWCPRKESNPHQTDRSRSFYPLNYGGSILYCIAPMVGFASSGIDPYRISTPSTNFYLKVSAGSIKLRGRYAVYSSKYCGGIKQ